MRDVVDTESITTIYSCRVDKGDIQEWHLVNSELEALLIDPNYSVATLKEIDQAIRVDIVFTDGIIHIQEGIYQWYVNEDDEDDFGYKFVAENKKQFAS